MLHFEFVLSMKNLLLIQDKLIKEFETVFGLIV